MAGTAVGRGMAGITRPVLIERGPYARGPYERGWYGPADWYEEPRRRRGRGRENASEDLGARLSELIDEVHRLEEELSSLRAPGSE